MKTTSLIIFSCLLVLLGSCTEEVRQDEKQPVPDEGNAQQEVMLTFRNKLLLNLETTKGETIATAEENAIASLDVYVFGSDTEEGEYSFMERFAYRADPAATLPAGAKELPLTVSDADGKETTGLLKVKRGLFVKLYCIANNSTLIDPLHEGQPVGDAAFVPLTCSEPGEHGTKIITAGTPVETAFATWHTRLLSADVPADTLATPLAMTGAYTTPLDLTDPANVTRVQAGVRLTRLAARYDIINEAGVSRFVIETVSMGNSRRGSGLFPIRPYGDTPEAKPGELITCPQRSFYGEKANKGQQAGAFYSYPSPVKDNGFLILKGMYKINETENKEVSYQIPFRQQAEDGSATALDIANNHRYTLTVMAADEYHLDCTLTVADWTDDGSIDEFRPDHQEKLAIHIPAGFENDTKYDPDTRAVSMSLKPGSTFDATTNTPAVLTVHKQYTGGPSAQQYDWLEVSEPHIVTKAAPMNYTYTFSLKDGYTGGRYPRAVLRFINTMNGDETTFIVEAVSVPQANITTQESGNRNTFDAELLEASMYRVTGSKVKINISCPDGTTIGSQPDWLDMKVISSNAAKTTYEFSIKDGQRDVTDDQGEIIFRNTKENSLETVVTVKLLDASVSPSFLALGGTDNTYDEPSGDVPGNVNMTVGENNTFTLSSQSLDGIKVGTDFGSGPAWFTHNGTPATKAGTHANEIQFSLVESEIARNAAQKATVTLQNVSGGKDYIFTVTPVFKTPVVASGTTMSPDINNYDAGENKLYLCLQPAGKTSVGSIRVTALGGSQLELPAGIEATLTASNEKIQEYELRLAGKDQTTPNTDPLTLKVMNKSDNTKYKEITLQPVLPEITNVKVVSADNSVTISGTDITTKLTADNTFNLDMKALGGKVSVVKKPDWLILENPVSVRTTPEKGDARFTFKVKNDATSFAEADLVLTNDAGGKPYTFKVKPAYQKPLITAGTMSPEANNLQGTTLNIYRTRDGVTSDATITLSALGGTAIDVSGGVTVSKTSSTQVTDSYTIRLAGNTGNTPYDAGPYTITVKNKTDVSQSVSITLYLKASMPVFTTDKGDAIKFEIQGNHQHNTYLYDNAVFYGTNGSFTLTVASPSGLQFRFGDQKDPNNSASTFQDVKQTKTWTKASPTDVYVISFKSTATFNPTKNIWYLYFAHNEPKFQQFELDEYIYFPVCLGKVPYPIVNANTTTTRWWCNFGQMNQATAVSKAAAIGSGWHIPTLDEYKAMVGFTTKPATVTDANWYAFPYGVQNYWVQTFGNGRTAYWLPDTNSTFEMWISSNKAGCSGVKGNSSLVVVK